MCTEFLKSNAGRPKRGGAGPGRFSFRGLALAAALGAVAGARGQSLDPIGVTLLRAIDPGVDGSGVRVAQVEADENTNQPPTFEVDPASAAFASDRFFYQSSLGVRTNFPNSVGGASVHAGLVGGLFYGSTGGVATNAAHVDNYDASDFILTYYRVDDQLYRGAAVHKPERRGGESEFRVRQPYSRAAADG